MTSRELFAVISPALAAEILEFTYTEDKPLYRTALDAVAQARKLRPVFLERQPRKERHATMALTLSRPALETVADGLLRNWLLKKNTALLTEFLDSLKIPHDKGVVEDLPAAVDEALLQEAVEGLLARHPRETVAVYLHSFHHMNECRWATLEAHLQTDPRLDLKR